MLHIYIKINKRNKQKILFTIVSGFQLGSAGWEIERDRASHAGGLDFICVG